MFKRIFDIFVSFIGLIVLSPILIFALFLVWLQDRKNPLYFGERVGKRQKIFRMIKIRSMIINAESSGVDSTSNDDRRITKVGRFIRSFKLDEITQLWNVLISDMSIVGPRPNVKRETDLYSDIELKLLNIKPGITDFASIVFSDEGDILEDYDDKDIAYNQLIRPRKSLLGLFYLKKKNFVMDIFIILITAICIISRKLGLKTLVILFKLIKAPKEIIDIARRNKTLTPQAPPGLKNIIISRELI